MQRLKSRKLIERLFKEGKPLAVFPLRVYYLFVEIPDTSLQAGFGVSAKHFKRAVDRNRIKRLMREAFRLQKDDLLLTLQHKAHQVAIFFIYTGKELPDGAFITAKMAVVLQRLIKIIHENHSAHP